jgi:hypothetical protein
VSRSKSARTVAIQSVLTPFTVVAVVQNCANGFALFPRHGILSICLNERRAALPPYARGICALAVGAKKPLAS